MSVELAALSNARQQEVHERFEDMLVAIDELGDFFGALRFWKVVLCSGVSFLAVVGAGASLGECGPTATLSQMRLKRIIARLLGPSVRWVWRRVGLTPRPWSLSAVSARRDQIDSLSRPPFSPIIQPEVSILASATQTTPSAATTVRDHSAKPSTSVQASPALKKEPCYSPVGITAFPRSRPLSTTNAPRPAWRLRFPPSLPVHDENSAARFTPSGSTLSSLPRTKSNSRRAQSVPVAIRF
jgi:hypothetical protein